MVHYQALYRQWRPRTFAEVVGQEHVTRTLLNALRSQRLVHAYLFCGPRGTGKTSTAKILAKAVNCRAPREGEPCNECPNCLRINAGNSLDVLEIDAASNRGIDEIRELIEKIPLGPVEGRYKVYIIDEVHMLTPEAFNALLKTLEEPPAHALFILATTEPRKVLPTILSRCQRFDFHPLTATAITGRLQQVAEANNVQIEGAALSLLARKAAGGLRDALSLLDQVLATSTGNIVTAEQVATVLGTARLDTLLAITDALAAGESQRMLHLIDEALGSGIEPQRLLEDLLEHARNLLLLQMDSGAGEFTGLLPEEVEQVVAQAQKFTSRRLLELMERLQEGVAGLRWNNQPRILLEMTLTGFLLSPGPSLDELIRRVNELEKRLAALEGSPSGRKRLSGSMGEAATAGTGSLHEQNRRNPQQLDRRKGEEVRTAGKKEPFPLLDLTAVRQRWQEVLAAARRESVHLQAYLRAGEPIAVVEDTLTLEVRTDFHRSMLEQEANRQRVEKVLAKVFGRPFKLNITAGSPIEQRASQEVLDKLVEYFGPDKVEIKD
ncbi:DNA polymerase III subunit gamma/tau [Neomoorella humiferrea]|uniref:DNA-directed DNA polymerase n=1 Tax=Neomoorella humiferrea TaxID=676965 RepID=A0A2T0ATM5_9FIRM|nr:DNA polymerase III subunit gamma/tau [Moorella humiferrea]PRR73824.1 DNA polymerase III subunit tau [Moorella humiferrea]